MLERWINYYSQQYNDKLVYITFIKKTNKTRHGITDLQNYRKFGKHSGMK